MSARQQAALLWPISNSVFEDQLPLNNKLKVHGGGIEVRIPLFTFHTPDRWLLGDNLPHKIQWLVLQLDSQEADAGMEFGMQECSYGKSRRKSGAWRSLSQPGKEHWSQSHYMGFSSTLASSVGCALSQTGLTSTRLLFVTQADLPGVC